MNSRKSLYDKQEFYRKGAILKASFQGMRYQVEKWQKTLFSIEGEGSYEE